MLKNSENNGWEEIDLVTPTLGDYERLSRHSVGPVHRWVAEWSTRFRATTLPGCSVWIQRIVLVLSIVLLKRRRSEVPPAWCFTCVLDEVKDITYGCDYRYRLKWIRVILPGASAEILEDCSEMDRKFTN